MTFGKKLEYLWMYYKGVLFGAVILVCLISIGITMYKGDGTPERCHSRRRQSEGRMA